MVDFVMRQGDELPQIERTFTVDGVAVDLTAVSNVAFRVVDMTDTTVFENNAAVTDALNGIVKYVFTSTDSGAMAPGFYKALFIADFGGKTLTAPNDGFISLQITSISVGLATYTGDPAARPLDAVRFMSRDTDMTSPRLSDAEISWLMGEHGNDVYDSAAAACENAAGTYASYRDRTVGPLSIRYGEQADRLYELAKNIRSRRGTITGFAPVLTQYSQTHLFEIGMHDNAVVADGGELNDR